MSVLTYKKIADLDSVPLKYMSCTGLAQEKTRLRGGIIIYNQENFGTMSEIGGRIKKHKNV